MIYLDNAATTRVTEPILNEMIPYFNVKYGNPSSVHEIGFSASSAIEEARKQVAKAINAKPSQIFFTSGATESNNFITINVPTVSSVIEHHSMEGCPYKATIEELTNPFFYENKWSVFKDCCISCMLVNNETGNIIDISPMVTLAHKRKMFFHTDATAAFGHYPIDVKALNVDSLSLSGHKFHAPKGVGILYLKEPDKWQPMIEGGGQERGLRAGTENVPCIVGIGLAAEFYNYEEKENQRQSELRRTLVECLKDGFSDKEILINTDLENSIPSTLNFSVKDLNGESLALLLNKEGICVSTGSACNSGDSESSYVLKAMDVPKEYINGTIRISMSRETTFAEVVVAAEAIKKNIKLLKSRK